MRTYRCVKSTIKSECCHITIQLVHLNFNLLRHLSELRVRNEAHKAPSASTLSIRNRISDTQYLDEKVDSPISKLVVPHSAPPPVPQDIQSIVIPGPSLPWIALTNTKPHSHIRVGRASAHDAHRTISIRRDTRPRPLNTSDREMKKFLVC